MARHLGPRAPTLWTGEGILTRKSDKIALQWTVQRAQPVEQQPKPRCDALACISATQVEGGLRSRRGTRRDGRVARRCCVPCRVQGRSVWRRSPGADARRKRGSSVHTRAIMRTVIKACGWFPVIGSVRYTYRKRFRDVMSIVVGVLRRRCAALLARRCRPAGGEVASWIRARWR